MSPFRLLAIAPLLLLAACASTGGGSGHIERANPSSFGFLNSYKNALHDFEQGRLMEARAKIMAMDRTRPDYKAARRLLVRRIEPARRKMLQFYLDRARAREKAGKWRLAARDFGQAAYFSIKPKRWLRRQHLLEMKIRQLRFDLLRRTLQSEDRQLLGRPRAFTPPRELADDRLLSEWRQERWDAIEERAQRNYSHAARMLRTGFPELALAYLHSALRLSPGDGPTMRMLEEAKKRLPKEISLAPPRKRPHHHVNSRNAAPRRKIRVQSAREIRRLMADRQWAKARRYALAWKQRHGEDADAILAALAKQARRFSEMGRQAVREERLDRAVALWKKAVTLAPENEEYRKALEWAQQMQERLKLLRARSDKGR
ncbi:MAG: hypothetical protein D6682_08460 [Zetaproteobacteria bacterium]|nr:MAG: hypothetical protein D6682_08460 [Zetaproteobacteria bacterium]